jgi:hypothetical protein
MNSAEMHRIFCEAITSVFPLDVSCGRQLDFLIRVNRYESNCMIFSDESNDEGLVEKSSREPLKVRGEDINVCSASKSNDHGYYEVSKRRM